jgi:hypothetical protein
MYIRANGQRICHVKQRVGQHARQRKYAASAKGRERMRKYEASARGRERLQRRIRVGRDYRGQALTPELASLINDHARRRISEFEQGQSARAEAESRAAGAVPTQAKH